MRRLIQIENIKTFSSNTFRLIISLHLLFFVLVLLSISRIELSMGEFSVTRLFEFPNVWGFFPWVASWFNLLLAVLIIVLTCNEYRYKTFRQQVMNGMHEGHLTLGKIYIILVIALYAFLLVFLTGLVSGWLTGVERTGVPDLSGFHHVGIYFIQTVAYMALALFFATLFKNNGLSIVLFVLYLFPGEVIIRKLIFPGIEAYFPAKVIGDLTPFPSLFTQQMTMPGNNLQIGPGSSEMLSTGAASGLAVLYVVIFLSLTFLLLRRRSF